MTPQKLSPSLVHITGSGGWTPPGLPFALLFITFTDKISKHSHAVVKRTLSQKAKLSIYWSIFIPFMTKRTSVDASD